MSDHLKRSSPLFIRWLRYIPLFILAGCQGDEVSVADEDVVPACERPDEDITADIPQDARTGFRIRREMCIDGNVAQLTDVARVAISASGMIAVTEPRFSRIKVFTPDGAHLKDVGRTGQGPGEYGLLGEIGFNNDSLWVFDSEQRRLTVLDPEFRVSDVIHLPSFGADPSQPGLEQRIGDVMRFISPDLLLATLIRYDPASTLYMGHGAPQTIHRVLLSGGRPALIAQLPPMDVEVAYSSTGTAGVRPPFPNDPLFAWSPNGQFVAAAVASVEGPSAGRVDLTLITASGDSVYRRSVQLTALKIPADVATQALEKRRRNEPRDPDESPLGLEPYRRAIRVPEYYPPMSQLVVSDDGSVWIGGRENDQGRRSWHLDPSGTIVESVVLPLRSRLVNADASHLWVVERDALDVPSLIRYGVGRTGE